MPKPHALVQKAKQQVNSKGYSHIISQMTFLNPVDLLDIKNGYNFSSVCGGPLILSKISTSTEDGHLLFSQMNHSCPSITQKFYWFFTPCKDLNRGCSGNLVPMLGSQLTQGPHSQNSPIFSPLPNKKNLEL